MDKRLDRLLGPEPEAEEEENGEPSEPSSRAKDKPEYYGISLRRSEKRSKNDRRRL
jgi:hypothetical protein